MSAADPSVPLAAAEAAGLFADIATLPAAVIAVSGGPDSTALLVLLARWRAARAVGPRLTAVTIDHGLRREAAAEAEAVGRCAADLGIAHRTLHWTGPKPTTGLQEAARAARYRLLAAAAETAGARHILTAHTLDDQAETVLFRLARGSGLSGLAGMAQVAPLPLREERCADGNTLKSNDFLLVRPLLGVPKARLIATLRGLGVGFAEDPSNRDPHFTRARLRVLLPELAAEGLTAARLGQLAERLRRADAAIEASVDDLAHRLGLADTADHAGFSVDRAGWAAAPTELRLRLLGRLVAAVGHEGAVELGKLEACALALADACRRPTGSARFRRTLAGAMVTLAAGRLAVEPAPPRRLQPNPPVLQGSATGR